MLDAVRPRLRRAISSVTQACCGARLCVGAIGGFLRTRPWLVQDVYISLEAYMLNGVCTQDPAEVR